MHWFRGNSYLKIGWHWIWSALSKGWELLTRLRLNDEPDPEPQTSSTVCAQPGPYIQSQVCQLRQDVDLSVKQVKSVNCAAT